MPTLAEKLRREFERTLNRRIISLEAYREAEKNAEEVETVDQLIEKGHDPLHALYVNTLNLVQMFSEHVTALPLMDRVARFMEKAEDIYVPGYPPMSCITVSYFNCWAFFDVTHGLHKETLGTCFRDLCNLLDLDSIHVEAAQNLCQSRMGIYTLLGPVGPCFRLRELLTGVEVDATIPTGFKGEPGALVYVRLLPPVGGVACPHVAMTTPYILVGCRETDWIDYFGRHQLVADTVALEERLHRHLKSPQDPYYWSEFAFYGYVNYRSDAIFLAGFPDRPETQPCHKKFDWRTLDMEATSAALG